MDGPGAVEGHDWMGIAPSELLESIFAVQKELPGVSHSHKLLVEPFGEVGSKVQGCQIDERPAAGDGVVVGEIYDVEAKDELPYPFNEPCDVADVPAGTCCGCVNASGRVMIWRRGRPPRSNDYGRLQLRFNRYRPYG